VSKSDFSATEWEALLNVPHLAYRAIALSEKDGLLTRRKEAKAN